MAADTAWLNEKSEGHFNSKRTLTGGLYFIASPDRKIALEFLLDSTQHFSVILDTAQQGAKFINSPENNRFMEYMGITQAMSPVIASLRSRLSTATTTADSTTVLKNLKDLNQVLSAYQDSIISKYPASTLAISFLLSKPARVPDGTPLFTRADSMVAYCYIKNHYWDGVAFNDDRLLYIPFFEQRFNDYFDKYLAPVADSVIPQLDYILSYARSGKQVYPYLLMKLTNRYMNPTHIGQNKILIHLFQDYYLKGDTTLLSDTGKKMLYARTYSLMANEPGDAAPQLDLTDTAGEVISLYSIKAPYTFVIFWDPTCHHCMEQVPRIDSMYQAKWRAMGVHIYSVNINNALVNEMTQFVRDKHLSTDWSYTYQTEAAAKAIVDKGLPNYHQLYDIYETPTVYLLDDNKRILAKGLTLQQFDAVLDAKK